MYLRYYKYNEILLTKVIPVIKSKLTEELYSICVKKSHILNLKHKKGKNVNRI